jgi:adenylylsulfate kinase-like enzyme
MGQRTLPPLLDPPRISPARLLASLRFERAGVGERVGRQVLLARAWPRQQPRPRGELSYELEFDSEHGTLLRRATSEDRRRVAVTEALEVCYGRQIDPERLMSVLPDDQPTRSVNAPRAVQTASLAPALNAGASARRDRLRRPAATVWLTGLSGAGKTTLASAIECELLGQRYPTCVLDGDELRQGLSSDLGLSRDDRADQARRAACIAGLVVRWGGSLSWRWCLRTQRTACERMRSTGSSACRSAKAWIDTPLAECEDRDPKGLYAGARSGTVRGLTGVDAPYEPPRSSVSARARAWQGSRVHR